MVTEAGSYSRLIDSCITQLKAQGPSRTSHLRGRRWSSTRLRSSQFKNNHSTEMCCGTEAGSCLRLIDSCITQIKAQGPSRTCNESKEEWSGAWQSVWRRARLERCQSWGFSRSVVHVNSARKQAPPWRQPRGKSMVYSVNSHTNATRIGWHLWEIDLRFAPGMPPGWSTV